MASTIETPSGTWKPIIRKVGFPTTSKTFRTERDAEDWSRSTEDGMVCSLYIHLKSGDWLT